MTVLNRDLVLNAGQGAELSLNHDAVVMCIFHNLLGQGDVLIKGLGGGIDHDGGEAAVDAGFAQLEGIAVVQVQRDGDLGVLFDRGLNQLDQIGVVGVSAGTLGNLQNNRALQLTGSFRDALDDLHVIDIESANGIAAVVGLFKHFFCGDKWHNSYSPIHFLKNLYKKHIYKFSFLLYPQSKV